MFPVKVTVSAVVLMDVLGELVSVRPPVEFRLVTPSAILEELLEVTVICAPVPGPPVKV